jgi:hypothetical protein
MIFRILIATIAYCTLLSCSTAHKAKILKNWVGHNKNDLVWVWGAPTRTYSDGAGGEVLLYVERRGVYAGTAWDIYRATYFYVGRDGEIYHTLVKNSKDRSQRINIESSTAKQSVAIPQ